MVALTNKVHLIIKIIYVKVSFLLTAFHSVILLLTQKMHINEYFFVEL